jgi:hypothetical protein
METIMGATRVRALCFLRHQSRSPAPRAPLGAEHTRTLCRATTTPIDDVVRPRAACV